MMLQSKGAKALTNREREVLLGLISGKRRAEIARAMKITTAMVDLHLRHIKDKLGARTTEEAVAKAFKRGIVEVCGQQN